MKLKKLLFIIPLFTLLAAVFLVAQTEIDPDGDGIPDVFEFFFGLEGDSAAPDADLYTDKAGRIFKFLKGGKGEGEFTGLNINDYW
jgi:hypothetical protein